MGNYEYIKNYYGVPAKYGRVVEIERFGRGIIVEDKGNYIGVLLDSDKPGYIKIFHPTCGVEYLGIELPRQEKLTRSQKRYREFKDADWFEGTFAEWMGFDISAEEKRLKELYGYME